MAEYCNKCAVKLGFEKEDYPLLCEGCGKYFEYKNWFKNILQWLLKTKN